MDIKVKDTENEALYITFKVNKMKTLDLRNVFTSVTPYPCRHYSQIIILSETADKIYYKFLHAQ